MNVKERNQFAQDYVTAKLDEASSRTIDDFADLTNFDELRQVLNNLVWVKAMGFRGLVLTAIVGLAINPDYDPLNNYYDSNPRSIFEKGIFYALRGRVPSGKSDPLNVAKNASVINENWAKGKRPERAALAAVRYLHEIMDADPERQERLIDFFFHSFWAYGDSVAKIKIVVPEREQLSNQEFAHICNRFVLEFPESGTVPQFVVFKLLEAVYAHSAVTVEGGLESVFGTNTTSKKPADIWLEEDGKFTNLFEITVKKVDEKRLDDCVDSLAAMGILDLPVQFICRLPQDVSELSDMKNSTVSVHGKHFDFQDIQEFIRSLITLLSQEQITALLAEFAEFLEQVERPVATKDGWNKILSEMDV